MNIRNQFRISKANGELLSPTFIKIKIILSHLESELGDAFLEAFAGESGVDVVQGDICNLEVDAIVSPANSFGFMDGGLDYALSHRFGWDLHTRLQDIIRSRPLGELLVGEALIIETGDEKIPWLISAPTMRIPMRLRQTINAYLAMKAIMTSSMAHTLDPKIRSVAIPGLGTGVGALPPKIAALQMKEAYDEVLGRGAKF